MKKVFCLFIFLILLIATSLYSDVLKTKPILSKKTNHLYIRVDTPMKWNNAKQYCKMLGGYLASINSEEEQNFVYNDIILNDLIADYVVANKDKYAIGGSDSLNEGIWKWEDGTYVKYDNFEIGHPYNNKYYNCLYIKRYNGKWSDDGCDYIKYPFICEFDSDVFTDNNINNSTSEYEIRSVYCDDNVSYETGYKKGYNDGYEKAKDFCKNNPEECGIVVNNVKEQNCNNDSVTYFPQTDYYCSYYDFISNTMHIPCVIVGAKKYWLDMSIDVDNYGKTVFRLNKYGLTYNGFDCNKFNKDMCLRYDKACKWVTDEFGYGGKCVSKKEYNNDN